MGSGKGYGKIILFGEHFVVHGASAFAAAISSVETVDIVPASQEKFITKKTIVPEYTHKAVTLIMESMGKSATFEVNISGDLPTYGGLGSSAAFSVAFARAAAEEFNLQLSDEEINQHAYAGEKAFHGNPSGIDNTVATYGGVLEFRRGATPEESSFKFLTLGKRLDLVVSFSGKYGPTAEMVNKVTEFRAKDENKFMSLMEEYIDISMRGSKALEHSHYDELGKMMDLNHELLVKLGVVAENNEKIVKLARANGALGAKVTGGGGGGCCMALARDRVHAEELVKTIEATGFPSFATVVESSGKT